MAEGSRPWLTQPRDPSHPLGMTARAGLFAPLRMTAGAGFFPFFCHPEAGFMADRVPVLVILRPGSWPKDLVLG